eukprot:CAMPEP_0116015128 /NCGR_PEP_ID=MMETSP0321-20121206/6658_1 /TAXON_ID=163516 /ORGANISM="Leptocylindrus danicus var. danicus, Strain B650" /LENGTH=122 /DNA_ID=CAMNT_0003484851 /DNA_START=264 /DNA_END=628 /DNA_ORIENTATION=+
MKNPPNSNDGTDISNNNCDDASARCTNSALQQSSLADSSNLFDEDLMPQLQRTNTTTNHNQPEDGSYQNILRQIEVRNFLYMSCLFSLNHAGVVSALVLVLADSGTIGLYQNAIINVTYTLS